MKKIYIAMAVLAAAVLSSCQQEKSFNELTPLGKNDVAFAIQGAATRSGDASIPARKGAIISLESSLFLEETIVDLNPTPATKGTPAYTENVGTLYNTMFVHAVGGSFGDNTFELLDGDMYPRKDKDQGDGWRYYHKFDADPWPSTDAVKFYFAMPADMEGVDFEEMGYDNGTITFNYTSTDLTNAADQQDILFAYTQLSKSEHDSYLPNGAPVNMIHALTGVKFAIANPDYDEEDADSELISIKEVSFTGLSDEGACTITAAGAVSWEVGDPSTIVYTSGTFGTPVDFNADGSFENNGDYPSSFSAAGNTNNLNDTDATQTFWFVPQVVPENATLTIKYTYGSSTVKTGEIPFGQVLNGVEWKAGQLRTYTIRVDEVNVMIEDEVTMAAASELIIDTPYEEVIKATSYKGSTKTDVTITNTGNTDAFIRAALIGQWLDEDGNPVFGFTDYTYGIQLVDSWYQDQFVNKTFAQGKFTGLPGYDTTPADDHNWVLGSDGYYYYKNIVPAGEEVPDALFTTYTVGDCPAVAVAGKVKNIYFTLEIATQAISAKRIDGSEYTYTQAWANAKAQR